MRSIVAYQNPLSAFLWTHLWVGIPLFAGLLLLWWYERKTHPATSGVTTPIGPIVQGELAAARWSPSPRYRALAGAY